MEPQAEEIRALNEAAPLLRFAAENWKDMPPQVVLDIQAAWQARQNSQWTPQIAERFWTAFNLICTAINPVTVESILTNANTIQRRSWRVHFGADQFVSLSARTAKRFLWLMLLLLAAAVAFGYVVNTAGNLRNEVVTLQAKDRDALARLESGKLSNSDYSSLMQNLIDDQTQARRDTQFASIITYLGWNTYKVESFDDEVKDSKIKPPDRIAILRRNEDAVQKYMAASWQMVSIINSMILPVILGAMGACAYVVRLISDQIRTSTFSPTSRIRDIARVALGALAGVVIGYGFSTSSAGMSSAALAFLAGYALDPVFATFDKIAQSFK